MNQVVLFLSLLFIGGAVADSTPTSLGYVESKLDALQGTIPAAGAMGADAGTSVITYTSTSGEIGERGLYTDASSYNASADADKLITASALNGAITSMPTTGTTALTCANIGCTLWSITDQTAYAAGAGGGDTVDPATLVMLQTLAGTDGAGYCYKILKDGGDFVGNCTTTPEKYGDWGTMFTYEGDIVQISGISACSSVDEGLSIGQVASNQSQIDADYVTSGGGATANTNPPGVNCYCQMTGPAESRWVFDSSRSSLVDCAASCAHRCGYHGRNNSNFRSGIFGSVQ